MTAANSLCRQMADRRPRIHIWSSNPPSWSVGPTGVRFKAPTEGEAFGQAMEHIGRKPAVVIYEGSDAPAVREEGI